MPVAVIKQASPTDPITVYTIHADHLNTPRVIVDATNTPVWQWANQNAYGDNLPNEDLDGDSQSFEYNLRFAGQYFDTETKLHYNYYRDYDPATGRYLSSDPIGLAGGLNTYGYVGGNPLLLTDPLGLYWSEEYVDYATGVIVGTGDFIKNYRDTRLAITINSDKYFHCKANCESTQRGKGGKDAAECLSDAREWFDQNI
jgi:RHS repeat-associated protein